MESNTVQNISQANLFYNSWSVNINGMFYTTDLGTLPARTNEPVLWTCENGLYLNFTSDNTKDLTEITEPIKYINVSGVLQVVRSPSSLWGGYHQKHIYNFDSNLEGTNSSLEYDKTTGKVKITLKGVTSQPAVSCYAGFGGYCTAGESAGTVTLDDIVIEDVKLPEFNELTFLPESNNELNFSPNKDEIDSTIEEKIVYKVTNTEGMGWDFSVIRPATTLGCYPSYSKYDEVVYSKYSGELNSTSSTSKIGQLDRIVEWDGINRLGEIYKNKLVPNGKYKVQVKSSIYPYGGNSINLVEERELIVNNPDNYTITTSTDIFSPSAGEYLQFGIRK